MLVKTDIPKLLLAGMRTNLMKAYGTASKDHEKLATTIKSTKSSETYPWLGGVPSMSQWKDERIPQGMLEHNFSIANRDWEASIAVDRNAIEDKFLFSLNSANSEKPLTSNVEGNSERSSLRRERQTTNLDL